MSLFIHTLGWQHQLQILKEEIFDIAGIFNIVVTKTAHNLSLLNLKQKQSLVYFKSSVWKTHQSHIYESVQQQATISP